MAISKTICVSEQIPHAPYPVDDHSCLLDYDILFLTGEIRAKEVMRVIERDTDRDLFSTEEEAVDCRLIKRIMRGE